MAKYNDWTSEEDFIEALERAYHGSSVKIQELKILHDDTKQRLDPYANSYSSRKVLVTLDTPDFGVVQCALITENRCYEDEDPNSDYGHVIGSHEESRFTVDCEDKGFCESVIFKAEQFRDNIPDIAYNYSMHLSAGEELCEQTQGGEF